MVVRCSWLQRKGKNALLAMFFIKKRRGIPNFTNFAG
jgi:hypothetical protein